MKKVEIKLNYQEANQPDICLEMQELANRPGNDFLIAVLAHGSVGTDEIIPYSDFDGLLILKNQAESHPNYKRFLNESERLMYRFDPLQHHGWFIIREEELKNYPQTRFPVELFQHSRLIYPKQDLSLQIEIDPQLDYTRPFLELCAGLLNKVNNHFKPKNAYQLKSLWSEIMLLPALYYQAKNKCGIFKKASFERLYHDFNKDQLQLISLVSDLRTQWNYPKKGLIYSLLNIQNHVVRKILTKYVIRDSGTLINSCVNKEFYKQLNQFILLLSEDLTQHESL